MPTAARTAGPASGWDGDHDGDHGAVTVEAALALCSLVVALALVVGAISAVAAQLRCLDAAREAARLTARGEQDRAEELARRIAPTGAVVAVTIRGDEITARVSANPVAGLLPGIAVEADAAAVLEELALEPAAPETVQSLPGNRR